MSTEQLAGTDLLTVQEVAALLRVHHLTVRRKIRSGELPAYRLGTDPHSELRIRREDLNQWLFGEPEGEPPSDPEIRP
jgi:excisionase family DNA binding protein